MCMCVCAAINCACLVYDGKLVVDSKFHTNNASIRAAGPLTKYKRVYYAKSTHENFNSKEIGVQVHKRHICDGIWDVCGMVDHANQQL